MSCVVGGPRPSSCAAENPGWQDDWAYGCRDWGAADCFQALSWGYTQAQFETLLQCCPVCCKYDGPAPVRHDVGHGDVNRRLDAGGAARLAPRRLGAPKLAAVARRVGARNCRVAGHVEARPGGGGTLDLVRGGRPRPLDVDVLVEFGVGEC